MVEHDVFVVIPAAGSGERLGGSVPKQYCKILGKPLLLYAVEQFLSFSWVKKLALVVDNIEKAHAIIQEAGLDSCKRLLLVKGGPSRHRSIHAGLLELKEYSSDEDRVVIVHDGVRPFVPERLVVELCDAALTHGAAGAIRPLVSTVLTSTADLFLDTSLDRSKHVASETPQAFRMHTLLDAYRKCTDEELDCGTECLQLVLKHAGTRAKLINGPEELWKVTHKKDLFTANCCLREKSNGVCIISEHQTPLVRMLEESLIDKVSCIRRVDSVSEPPPPPSNDHKQRTFNTVIIFHMHEIQQDEHLLDFASLLDVDKDGLIVHIIDNARVDGMQSMSVYNLHRNGRKMAHHHEKLHKGVVVIHCVTSNEEKRLIELVSTLVQADPTTFTGQTFFL